MKQRKKQRKKARSIFFVLLIVLLLIMLSGILIRAPSKQPNNDQITNEPEQIQIDFDSSEDIIF